MKDAGKGQGTLKLSFTKNNNEMGTVKMRRPFYVCRTAAISNRYFFSQAYQILGTSSRGMLHELVTMNTPRAGVAVCSSAEGHLLSGIDEQAQARKAEKITGRA